MSVINSEDAIAELMSLLPKLDRGLIHWTGVKAMLEALPPAQSEPKTGRWISMTGYNNSYRCSVCGRMLINITDGKNTVIKNYPYCHCGAKMEKGENNDNSK